MSAPTCAPGVRGKKTTTPQSASLTAPLTRGALGAAAPVQQYDRVKDEGGRAASLPQSASLTAPSSEGAFGVRCGFTERSADTGGFDAAIPQSASLTAPFTQGSLRALGERPYMRAGGAGEKDDYPSVSFADSSPHKGSLGRCRARGRHWARRKAERWRACCRAQRI